MPRAGPKAAVPPEEIVKKVLEFEIINSDGNVKSKSDIVWNNIAASFNNLVKPVTLYFFVLQDRYNCLTNYKNNKGIEKPVQDREYISVVDDDLDNSNGVVSPPIKTRKFHRKNRKNLLFDIIINREEWLEIQPITKIGSRGEEYQVLQEGWTDLVRKALWKEKKLPCAYSFKRHIIDDPEEYLAMYGSCTSCKTDIKITLSDKPDESLEPVSFQVSTMDCTHIPHSKKVRLQGTARQKVKEDLRFRKPKEWRRELVKETMDYGDSEPPFAYNLSALQKASQDAKNDELGIEKGVSVVDSIMNLTESIAFNKFIRHISVKYFSVTYWSPEQIELYKEILELLNNPFSLDATGSIVIPIKMPNLDKHTCFLSVLCTHINNIIVPVCQAISEVNDTNFYIFRLSEFLKSGAKYCPKEVVTDMGKALQNAICLAFNHVTFKQYNDRCIKILKGNCDKTMQLKTQLRTDISHLEHAVTKWPCVVKAPPRVKELFKRCVGFMTTIDNLDNFSEFLRQVLVVGCTNMHTDDVVNALKDIVTKIKTFDFEIKQNENHNEEELLQVDNNDDADDDGDTLISHFLKDIKDSVKVDELIDDDFQTPQNEYCSPEIIDYLMNLYQQFPCWTNVMNSYFKNPRKVATSSRSENYFGQCKRSLLENKVPLRLDKFLIKHCRQIDVDMKIVRAAVNNEILERKLNNKQNLKTIKSTHNYSYDYLYEVENWRNQHSVEEQQESEHDATATECENCNNENVEESLLNDNFIMIETPTVNKNEGSIVIEEQIDLLDDLSDLPIISNLSDIPLTDHTFSSVEMIPITSSSVNEDEKQDPVKVRGTYVRPAPDFDIHLQKGKEFVKTPK